MISPGRSSIGTTVLFYAREEMTICSEAGRNTLLRDALIHSLACRISNIAAQAYRPVVVYINGDYFGVYNLRDDTDNDYLEQHYGIPKEENAIIALWPRKRKLVL